MRAAGLDQAVRLGLAQSLRTIFDSLDDSFSVNPDAVGRLLASVEAAPVKPRIFGAYVELVTALFDDRIDEAKAILDELLSEDAAAASLRVVTIDDRELGLGQSERYRRLVNDDVEFVLEPVSGADRVAATAALQAAFDLLADGAPEAGGEFRALFREVVLVTNTEGRGIGGASSFALWGAVLLNTDCLCDRLTGAVALAHEAAHAHLFGLALGGRLVENSDDERYLSPLRSDPRPMEGIVHAVYVLGRMILTLRALLDSEALTPAETSQARDQLRVDLAAYDDGLATLRTGARFTPAGAGAFADLRRYMNAP
jgi:HEXXH motif-containing protein